MSKFRKLGRTVQVCHVAPMNQSKQEILEYLQEEYPDEHSEIMYAILYGDSDED